MTLLLMFTNRQQLFINYFLGWVVFLTFAVVSFIGIAVLKVRVSLYIMNYPFKKYNK